jgi:hypothetical protein
MGAVPTDNGLNHDILKVEFNGKMLEKRYSKIFYLINNMYTNIWRIILKHLEEDGFWNYE